LRVRFGLLAGSAMPDGLLNRIQTGFPIRDIYTNWGMTELSSIATMTVASDPVEKKLKSAGRLLPNFTGKIVDPSTSKTLPWGHRGEIVISGFGVMHSYYGQADRTAEAIRRHSVDDDDRRQWMHTGDEGYLDKEGYFVITGRIKDLIIRGGENISPIEIESRLYQHPAIKQCAVFAVPSRRYGEEVAAMLELSNDGQQRPSDTEIRSFVVKELARYKAPKHIWWLGDAAAGVPCEWPKTANGKLRKDDIRAIGKGEQTNMQQVRSYSEVC
jgi:acyl-CoA synthetase (AMP-forming)/AMP-acid ligase II